MIRFHASRPSEVLLRGALFMLAVCLADPPTLGWLDYVLLMCI